MALLRRIVAGVAALLRRTRVEKDLDEELRAYLEAAIDAKVAAGMSRERAARLARIELGSAATIKDCVRDERWEARLEDAWRDVRYAFRTLHRTPGFTAVAVVTLALGIGASTAVFSAVDAIVLRPLPFDEPHHLVAVGLRSASQPGRPLGIVAPQDFLDWQGRQSVARLAALAFTSLTLRQSGSTPQQVNALRVSPLFFDVLRVRPVLGQAFSAAHETDGSHKVAVIGYGLWQTQFGGAPDIVGRIISLDDDRYRVLGVAPRDFSYPLSPAWRIQLWIPLVIPADHRIRRDGRINAYLQVVGRLEDGVRLEQAQSGMDRLAGVLRSEHPNWYLDDVRVGVIPLHEHVIGGDMRAWLLFLLGAVALVMLIVCANVANLLLARASVRDREMGIRAALGAGRRRLLSQLLVESLVLSSLGGAAGLLIGWAGVFVLRAAMPDGVPRAASMALDGRVLATALAATALTGLLVGFVPAIRGSRASIVRALKEGALVASPGRAALRLRSVIVVAELALAVVLLVGAGLFVGSFVKLMQVDVGYEPDRVLMTGIVLPESARAERGRQTIQDIVERVKALPGVESAAFLSGTDLFGMSVSSSSWDVPGRPKERESVYFSAATEAFRGVMGIQLRSGRFFDERDRVGGEPVVVLGETTARVFFPGVDPVDSMFAKARVIGVVGDIRFGPEREVPPRLYRPLAAESRVSGGMLLVKTAGDPLAALPVIRAAVHAVVPEVALRDVTRVADRLDQLSAHRRLSMLLLGAFGALGLVIAAIGVYGVMAYTVSQRTREVGLRVALGATRQRVALEVLRSAAALAGMGLLLGTIGAWFLSALARPFLFQLEPTDPRIFALAVTVLAASAVAASIVPARRAANIDPLVAIRAE